MTEVILRNIAVGTIAASIVAGAATLIGASWYDITQNRRLKDAKRPVVGRGRTRPLVSVVVYSFDQVENSLACLTSILKSSQRKLEVIVINNGSTSATKLAFKQFAAQHPKRAISVINKRRTESVETAVKTGLRAAKGDVIAVVNSQHRFERQTLSKAADAFITSQESALIPATLIQDYPSALNLWLRFKSLLYFNWQKTASLLRPSGTGVHFGVFYSRAMAKRPKPDQGYRFVGDIVLRRQLAPSISGTSTSSYELAVAKKGGKKSALRPLLSVFKLLYRVLALPIFTWYALYLAMNQGYSYPLILGWAIFTFVYIFAIWTSHYAATRAKANLTLLAPAVFSLGVIMVFVEAVATAVRLITPKKYAIPKTGPAV